MAPWRRGKGGLPPSASALCKGPAALAPEVLDPLSPLAAPNAAAPSSPPSHACWAGWFGLLPRATCLSVPNACPAGAIPSLSSRHFHRWIPVPSPPTPAPLCSALTFQLQDAGSLPFSPFPRLQRGGIVAVLGTSWSRVTPDGHLMFHLLSIARVERGTLHPKRCVGGSPDCGVTGGKRLFATPEEQK